MRIAQISPLYESVPPKLYGGTERIVAFLTDALVDMGHEVTLFAAGDARTKAELVATRRESLRLDPNPLKCETAAHFAMLQEVRRRADDFDVFHFHLGLLHFPFFEDRAHQTVTTLHGRLDLADLAGAFRCWPEFPLVSISHQQQKPLPSGNWAGVIHHGLPRNLYVPSLESRERGYLAFLGRISPEKRPDRAIRIAKRCGVPLKIAAKVDAADRAYYTTVIKPMIDDPLIEYVGEISDAEKSDFLGNAIALLFPIDWPEPFGLAMIEAMACGTPVIAWNCGSVPEIIDPGITGVIVSTEARAADAVATAVRLDRTRIRATWERRFSAEVMAAKYVRLFAALDSGTRAVESPVAAAQLTT